MGRFADQVRAFADVTKKDLRTVAANSIQDVLEHAQTSQPSVKITGGSFEIGKIPVDSSDLIKSLVSKINGAPTGRGALSYTTAIAGFEIGDVMQFEWTEDHAMRIEHGFIGTDKLGRKYNVPGRHFVGANAERFPEFVDARVAEVRAR